MVHLEMGEVAVQAWRPEPNDLTHMWKNQNYHHNNKKPNYVEINLSGGRVEWREETGGSMGLTSQPG